MTTFSFDTIKDFDKHIDISVPNYKHIYELIESISTYFIKKNTCVYDLGCSTGNVLKMLSIKNDVENVRFIGYEKSENMRPPNEMGFDWIETIECFFSSLMFKGWILLK